ncbi:MAG TPA: bifunctional diguanylate cyclase/phosphodiesterase [Armatimonadaceae bacterium]|nr:bifunctional diguanylate cyclase/phosphodiesterase [Armatimonadaceae bacterium]
MPLPAPKTPGSASSARPGSAPGEALVRAADVGGTAAPLLPLGADVSIEENFWELVRSPRASSGIALFLRVRPRRDLSPLDMPALTRQFTALLEEASPGRSVPRTAPVARNTYLVTMTGTFASAEIGGLRDRLQALFARWALDSDAVAMVEVTDPFTWWGHPNEVGSPDDQQQHPVDALLRVLVEESLTAVFQPVVSLRDGSILGHEALVRGAEASPLARPDDIFACATRMGLLFEVDTLCQRIALATARDRGLTRDGTLFVNIHPASLRERAFHGSPLVRAVEEYGFSPSQVVIELTERQAIHDFAAFERALRAYRDAGFRIAVDDAGAGYSSLQAIAEVSPDFIKVDRSLVRGIDTAQNRRALLAVVSQFASQIGTRLIAEGIETMAEMATLIELGIEFGQGFYLARPGAVPEGQMSPEVSSRIVSAVQRRRRTLTGSGVPTIGEMRVPASPEHTLRPNEIVETVQERFFALDGGDGMAVVGADGRPVGLLMKRSLQARLSVPYGHAMLLRKLVMLVMDADPLVLEADVSMDEALQRLLARGQGKLDDHILVTDESGLYVGHVPARRLLEQMSRLQLSQARYANPLTGLPGNVQVEQEVNARLEADVPLALLYVDLDNFKPFNDRYGVAHGDEVIRALGQALLQTVDERGDANDFVGHLGGDDFLLITTPDAAPAISREVVRRFESAVPLFYAAEDRARGGFVAHDRSGVLTKFPMLTLSVAGIGNVEHPLQDWLHATEVLGALKTEVKRLPPPRIHLSGMGEPPLPPRGGSGGGRRVLGGGDVAPSRGAPYFQGRKGGQTARPGGSGAADVPRKKRKKSKAPSP